MDLDNIKADEVLDAKGLSCPMPLLRTKKAINSIKSGQILPGWAERSGHKYLGTKEGDGFFHFYIQKG